MGACGSTKNKSSVAKSRTLDNKKEPENTTKPIKENQTFTNPKTNGIPAPIKETKTDIIKEINKPADPNPNRKRYKKRKDLDDGGYYDGELFDGKPDGYGIREFKNGDKYEGTFKDGNIDGKGKFISKDGEVYDGEFKDNKHFGFGILTFPDDSKYEGNFVNDEFEGNGKYTYI